MWFVYQENEKPVTVLKKVKVEDKSKVEDKKIRLTSDVFEERYYS